MKTLLSQENFGQELRGWAWRVILCALPSAGWAWKLEFNHPLEVAAMLSAIGVFIMAFAVGSTWMTNRSSLGWSRFQRALKMAAGIKIGALVGIIAFWTIGVGGLPKLLDSLIVLIWPDLLMGLCSVELVGFLRGMRESTDLARLDSFAFTGLITLLQGAFIGILLGLIALVVLGVQGACRWTKRGQISPAPV